MRFEHKKQLYVLLIESIKKLDWYPNILKSASHRLTWSKYKILRAQSAFVFVWTSLIRVFLSTFVLLGKYRKRGLWMVHSHCGASFEGRTKDPCTAQRQEENWTNKTRAVQTREEESTPVSQAPGWTQWVWHSSARVSSTWARGRLGCWGLGACPFRQPHPRWRCFDCGQCLNSACLMHWTLYWYIIIPILKPRGLTFIIERQTSVWESPKIYSGLHFF